MTPELRDLVVEIAAAILIALAAVATAWSGYQASQWHGEQALAQSRSNTLRVKSVRAADAANRQIQIDVATFMQWVDAHATDETELAAFYRRRFRDELRPAFARWLALRPLTTPGAPLTPFQLAEYRPQKLEDANALMAEADAASDEKGTDLQRAEDYVLAVVLFATSLALGGIGSRLPLAGARMALVALGWIVFLGTVAWLATFPVSV